MQSDGAQRWIVGGPQSRCAKLQLQLKPGVTPRALNAVIPIATVIVCMLVWIYQIGIQKYPDVLKDIEWLEIALHEGGALWHHFVRGFSCWERLSPFSGSHSKASHPL